MNRYRQNALSIFLIISLFIATIGIISVGTIYADSEVTPEEVTIDIGEYKTLNFDYELGELCSDENGEYNIKITTSKPRVAGAYIINCMGGDGIDVELLGKGSGTTTIDVTLTETGEIIKRYDVTVSPVKTFNYEVCINQELKTSDLRWSSNGEDTFRWTSSDSNTSFLDSSDTKIHGNCWGFAMAGCCYNYSADITMHFTEAKQYYIMFYDPDDILVAIYNINVINHSYTSKLLSSATCKKLAVMESSCSKCGDSFQTEVGILADHSWNKSKTIDTEPTCTSDGSMSTHCSVCDAIDETTVTAIPKVDHIYSDWTVTKEASCTEDGSKEQACEMCGKKGIEAIPATGHSFSEEYIVDTPATCTGEGSESKHCSVCGEIDEDSVQVIPKIDHQYGGWTVTKAATCTEGGSQKKVCESCGDTVTEVIEAKGHTWGTTPVVDKPASCTDKGVQSIHCANCDETKDAEEIPATGHSFGEWETVEASTCENEGLKQHVCANCGLTETENLEPLNHDWEETPTIDVQPTCTEPGSQSVHCTRCGAVKDSEELQATGHSYGDWVTTKEATCKETGSKKKACASCGDTIIEEIPIADHSWNANPTVDKAATCKAAGSKSIHCSVCGVAKEGSAQPIAKLTTHKFGAWKITKAATEIAVGQKTRTCSVCGRVEKQSIAMLRPTLPAVKITSAKAAKKATTVKWKKVSKANRKKIASIQIQYSMDKTFKTGTKTVTAKKSAASKKIKKLTSKKTYYVRIRAYKKTGNTVHVSAWSAIKSVKVK